MTKEKQLTKENAELNEIVKARNLRNAFDQEQNRELRRMVEGLEKALQTQRAIIAAVVEGMETEQMELDSRGARLGMRIKALQPA